METDIFQSRLSGLKGDTLAKYRRAIASLDSFLLGHALTRASLSPTIVEDWTFELLRQGKTEKVAASSLNILSSCLKEAVTAPLQETAKSARRLARQLEAGAITPLPLMRESLFSEILSLLKGWIKGKGEQSPFRDLLLVSLLDACMPLKKAARIRKDDIPRFAELIRTILERNQSATRLFVFDLRQSFLTPRQLQKTVASELASIFDAYNIYNIGVSGFDADELIRSLWAALAIHCGATASEALGCVGGSARYAVPAFVTPSTADEEATARLSKAIGAMLTKSSPRWFALQMRRGVTFDELNRAVHEDVRPLPQLFYPCQTIARNVRNRRVLADRPFISRTVFFKTDIDAVLPMFAKIGDLAWCYRVLSSSSAPYAVIPSEEMRRFQTAIGHFTPDMEIHSVGEIPLRPNDRVVLLMADFFNQEGTVGKVMTDTDGRTIYRVIFLNEAGFEWSVDASAPQLKSV